MTPAYQNPFNAGYRGFEKVTETDAAGNKITHLYHSAVSWDNEVKTGREYETVFKDALGVVWLKEETYWVIREVSNNSAYGVGLKSVNFVYPFNTSTTLRDGSKTSVTNTFDDAANCAVTECFGLLTAATSNVHPDPWSQITSTTTKTAYHKNTAKWLFLPKYVEQIDSANGNALLGCARTYYDGANTTTAAAPAIGIVTATSAAVTGTVAQCELEQPFTSSTNAYMIYETHTNGTKTYGNVAQSSIPTSVNPESHTPPSGTWFGWIPTGQTPPVSASLMLYDPTHHVFPLSVTNVLGHVSNSAYDFRLGKPTVVTEPTGRVTTTVYDTFGRVERVYDSLDLPNIPTVEFTYSIGAVNKVTTKQRTAHHNASAFRMTTSCMDGFGREYDRREQFRGTDVRSTRTDYDARGLTAMTSAPAVVGTAIDCAWYSTIGFDRTAFAYDPLGNVISTMALAPSQSGGPSQQTVHNGLSTITYDEKFNRTEQVQNPLARTTTIKESSAAPSVITLRPNGQGVYAAWNVTPNVAPPPPPTPPPHYQSVDDVTPPDEDATYVDDFRFGARDSHTYPSAELAPGAVISSVRYNVRWRHLIEVGSNPINGIDALFYQASVPIQGPSFAGTFADGWRNDKWELAVNPRTGQPWTVAELNDGLQFGFQTHNGSGPHPAVTQAWIEILVDSGLTNNTTYQYDGAGHLKTVTDSAGNVTSMDYDLLGRKLTMDDPDMGDWSYTYNAAGSLKTQTDARLITTTLNYDAAERLTQKTYSNLAPSVTFAYDAYNTGANAPACAGASTAVGRMTMMTDGSGQQYNCYDTRGRSTLTRRMVDSAPYNMAYAYNALDAVTQITYPDGDAVQYSTTPQGDMIGMSSQPFGQVQQALVTNAVTKPWGALESLSLNNSLVTSYGYDFRKRVTSIQTGSAQNVTLTYDDASNVKSVSDWTGTSETVTYTYDHLNRLTGGTGFAGGATAVYAYNAIGNMTAKQEGAASLTHTYPAAGTARPHAVSSISGTLARTFAYDANGNMIASASSTTQVAYGFDAENRLTEIVSAPPAVRPAPGFDCVDQNNSANGAIQVNDIFLVNNATGQTPGRANFALRDIDTSGVVDQPDVDRIGAKSGQNCSTSVYRYTYDGAGTLLKRTLQQNGTTTSTIYIGGVYEKTNTGAIKKYYAGFGRTIAVRDVPTGSGNGTLSYILPDHLGSASVITSDAGAVISEMAYWPYGATRSGGITQTDKRYTGQQEEPGDAALGLYNYKARFYSTTLGRFVSADSSTTDGLNRYTYAVSNPLAFTDPSGHCVQRPNGRWMECSRKTMIRHFFCAWGGKCNSRGFDEDAVRAYARAVVNSDAFKFFVGLESTARGDITLHYTYQVEIRTLVRHVGDSPAGRAILSFSVNATKRKLNYAYGEFQPGEGLPGLDNPLCNGLFCVGPDRLVTGSGWEARITTFTDDHVAFVGLDAGPEGSLAENPVGVARDINGVGVEIRAVASFEADNLEIDLKLEKVGGHVGGHGIKFIDVLDFAPVEESFYGY